MRPERLCYPFLLTQNSAHDPPAHLKFSGTERWLHALKLTFLLVVPLGLPFSIKTRPIELLEDPACLEEKIMTERYCVLNSPNISTQSPVLL